MTATERWPPSYDATELAKTIGEIKKSVGHQSPYYQNNLELGEVCQGDVIELESDIPVIGRTGVPSTVPSNTKFWTVIGNTCDFARNEVFWISICPVFDLSSFSQGRLQSIRDFDTSRFYHVKPWGGEVCAALAADLTQTVCISKSAIVEHGQHRARLGYESWLLLNCCLVRFLARDDGRHD